jgi:hypothetical protein
MNAILVTVCSVAFWQMIKNKLLPKEHLLDCVALAYQLASTRLGFGHKLMCSCLKDKTNVFFVSYTIIRHYSRPSIPPCAYFPTTITLGEYIFSQHILCERLEVLVYQLVSAACCLMHMKLWLLQNFVACW